MDGIDVALLETDGERVGHFGPSATHVYRDVGIEAAARRDRSRAQRSSDRESRPGIVAEAERMVTTLHAEAVKEFLDANRIDRKSVDVVGFHGQTLLHRPERRLTVQIGDGEMLARELGIPVVYDFRAADVAAGRAGGAARPGLSSRAGADDRADATGRGAQCRRRRECDLHRRTGGSVSPAIPVPATR